jgi:hypothetical protein
MRSAVTRAHRCAGSAAASVIWSKRSTTTETGLKVCCEIDGNLYPKGVKVSDQEMAELNIKGNASHPEWNYNLSTPEQLTAHGVKGWPLGSAQARDLARPQG